jgi:hypothetical protein
VPASIDATGSSDAAAALNSFVSGVPDGSTIVFRQGGVYRMDHGLKLTNRRNLVFEGNGATLRVRGSGSLAANSAFALWNGNVGITIRNFTLVGNNPDAGTPDAYHGDAEEQMGVLIWTGTNIELYNLTIRGFYGDCVYIGTNVHRTWSDTVTFRDSSCSLNGRNGVTIIAARNVTIERVSFDQIGASIVDMEPDYADNGAQDVVIRNNSVGDYALNNRYTSWLLAAEGATGSTMRNVSLVGNTITADNTSGVEGRRVGLHVTVRARGPRINFQIRNNTATQTVVGPSMQYIGVDGVTVTGNVQPLSSGSLARYVDCTNVIHD